VKFAIIRKGFYSNKFACGEDFSFEYISETSGSDFLNDLKVIGKVLDLGFGLLYFVSVFILFQHAI